jgi:hypothetical protein
VIWATLAVIDIAGVDGPDLFDHGFVVVPSVIGAGLDAQAPSRISEAPARTDAVRMFMDMPFVMKTETGETHNFPAPKQNSRGHIVAPGCVLLN